MSESRNHPSRLGWADPMDGEPPPLPEHVCRLPKPVRLGLIGLVAAVLLLAVSQAMTAIYVYQANQYVQGRGEYRDLEAARMEAESEARIRRAMCDLLDQLPEGVLLDRPRAKYGCGPGIPVDLLTPEEQERIGAARSTPAGPESAEPSTAVDVAPPVMGSAASPDAPDPVPNTPGSPPTPEQSPSPDPLVDLGPITDPVCDALGVCL